MAGLLAATVLSRTYARVTILDRDASTWLGDRQPDGVAGPRPGVAHGRQPHGLLARGYEVVEELFPGLGQELVDAGALRCDMQRDFAWWFEGHPLARGTSDLGALVVSRPLLESRLRRRVVALPGVRIVPDHAVLGLVSYGGRVTGVKVDPRGKGDRELYADLVVDASGRTSNAPRWLVELGYPAPHTERVRVDLTYGTRLFRRRDTDVEGLLGSAFAGTPAAPRSAILLAQEGGTWSIGLGGRGGVRPPLELAAYREYADSVNPQLGRLVRDAEPLDDGRRYTFRASSWHRYDRLRTFPDGFVVLGDAVASFNPVFGQGMTVAATQVLALGRALADGDEHLGLRFFAASRPLVQVPWQTAVGVDMSYPQTQGERTLAMALMDRYIKRLQRAAHHDRALAADFLRVVNLTESPATLMAPSRVLRTAVRGRPSAGSGAGWAPQPSADPPGAHIGARVGTRVG